MVSYQEKDIDGQLVGLSTTIRHEASSADGEIGTEDMDEVLSDGAATIEMIHDFVEHLPGEPQWRDDSFDDGTLLMQGVSSHAVRRAEEVAVEVKYDAATVDDGGPTTDISTNEGHYLHSYGEYNPMDDDSWTEESIIEDEEDEEEEEEDEVEDEEVDDYYDNQKQLQRQQQQYQTLSPEYTTYTQDKSRSRFDYVESEEDFVESEDVIVIEDPTIHSDAGIYGGLHDLVLEKNQNQTIEDNDSIDGMPRKYSKSDGQIIKETLMQKNNRIEEISCDDKSEVVVHEIKYNVQDEPEDSPNEENRDYGGIMAIDLTHEESIVFIEEKKAESEAHGTSATRTFFSSEMNGVISTGEAEESVYKSTRSELTIDEQSDGESRAEESLNEVGILGAQKREGMIQIHDDSDDDVLLSENYYSNEDTSMNHSTGSMAKGSNISRTFSGMISCKSNSTEEYVHDHGTAPLCEIEDDSPVVHNTMTLDDIFVRGNNHDTYTDHGDRLICSASSKGTGESEADGCCSSALVDVDSYASNEKWSKTKSPVNNITIVDHIHMDDVNEHYEEEYHIEVRDKCDWLATPEPQKRIGYRRSLTFEELTANNKRKISPNGVLKDRDSYTLEGKSFHRGCIPESAKRIGSRATYNETQELMTKRDINWIDPTQDLHWQIQTRPLDEDQKSTENSVLFEGMVQTEDHGDNQQSSLIVSGILQSGSVTSVSQVTETHEETAREQAISKAKHLEACIEEFGYYLDQRQNLHINEYQHDGLLNAARDPPSERSGIYREVPWIEDPAADGQIIVRREDISRVPSHLLADFREEDGTIRLVAFDKILSHESVSCKSESASVYTDPDKDVSMPLDRDANTRDRLGTSLVVPMGLVDRTEEHDELENSIIAESLGMDGVEDAMRRSNHVGNEDRTRKSVSWNEFAHVKSDDPCLKSGPVKLGEETYGRSSHRNKEKDTKKVSGCTRLCEVFHEAPYWTKVLVYMSITMLCIAFGIILTAVTSRNSTSNITTPALRITLPPTPSPIATTIPPTMSYDLEPPHNVTVITNSNGTTTSPTGNPLEDTATASSEMSNITSDLVDDAAAASTSPTSDGDPVGDDDDDDGGIEPLVPTSTPVTAPAPATETTPPPPTTIRNPTTTATMATPVTPPPTITTNRPPFLWGKWNT